MLLSMLLCTCLGGVCAYVFYRVYSCSMICNVGKSRLEKERGRKEDKVTLLLHILPFKHGEQNAERCQSLAQSLHVMNRHERDLLCF